MKCKFNTLQFSASLVKFWLRLTLRNMRKNFTIFGLTRTLQKASEILINATLTKTIENLNTWRWSKLSARAGHAQQPTRTRTIYAQDELEAGSWKRAGSKLEAGEINTKLTCICKLERV